VPGRRQHAGRERPAQRVRHLRARLRPATGAVCRWTECESICPPTIASTSAAFLTADIAAIQIQKGLRVRDRRPPAPWAGGDQHRHDATHGAIPGRRRNLARPAATASRAGPDTCSPARAAKRYYVQGSVTGYERELVEHVGRLPAGSELARKRGHTRAARTRATGAFNLKAGFTPHDGAEYAVNIIRQNGEKGAPLNVYTNPLVAAEQLLGAGPYWDLQNVSFHTNNQLGPNAYLKTKTYYNTFDNGLSAFDDITYTTQSANGRFDSPYHDHAAGTSIEFGSTRFKAQHAQDRVCTCERTCMTSSRRRGRRTRTLRCDSRSPCRGKSQDTWSVAAENTFHASERFEVVGGRQLTTTYNITKSGGLQRRAPLVRVSTRRRQRVQLGRRLCCGTRPPRTQYHVRHLGSCAVPDVLRVLQARAFGTATPKPEPRPRGARRTSRSAGKKRRHPGSRRPRRRGVLQRTSRT